VNKTARRNGPSLFSYRLGVAAARLIERLLGIFVALAGCLALLAGFLATALLLSGLLTRCLILLARLVLVRHVYFLSWERQYNGLEFEFVPDKEKMRFALV
jgi:hypothetical protein